jgi:hypothetical protein
MPDPFHMRVIWTAANTVKFAVSPDAVQWITMGVGTNVRVSAITPTHFFIGLTNIDATDPTIVAFDYIRISTTDLSV